ncbi:MAG: hypothetical protein HWE07_06380, partial [Cytophagia bacterium]|nr:hypothetical protein [Cytophagia bacterium]
MRLTTPPQVDNTRELQNVAEREAAAGETAIRDSLVEINEAYAAFEETKANPWALSENTTISDRAKKVLKVRYKSARVNSLEFIKDLRSSFSTDFCLMCGGYGNGSLDHYLPQSMYPEFAIYSNNLVPACNCNSLRGNRIMDENGDGRIIHPYYDLFLEEQLYVVRFNGGFREPSISIDLLNPNHVLKDIFQYHLNNVILRT